MDGKQTTDFPCDHEELERAKPIFTTLKSWKEDITAMRNFADLPKEAKDYISFVGHELATPVSLVSIGPGREQTLFLKDLYNH